MCYVGEWPAKPGPSVQEDPPLHRGGPRDRKGSKAAKSQRQMGFLMGKSLENHRKNHRKYGEFSPFKHAMCDYQLVISPVGGNWFRHFSSLDAAAGGLVLRSQASYVVSVVCIFFIGRLRLSPAGGWLCSVLALLDGARRWELGLSRCPRFFLLAQFVEFLCRKLCDPNNQFDFCAWPPSIASLREQCSPWDIPGWIHHSMGDFLSRLFSRCAYHDQYPKPWTLKMCLKQYSFQCVMNGWAWIIKSVGCTALPKKVNLLGDKHRTYRFNNTHKLILQINIIIVGSKPVSLLLLPFFFAAG